MKDKNKNKKISEKREINIKASEIKQSLYYPFAVFFFLSFFYFLFFGHYIFFYQENFLLFIYSSEFLQKFIDKPGGLLEYSGCFLTQGYFSIIYGSIIVSLMLLLIAFLYTKLTKVLFKSSSPSIFPNILPPSLLLLLQTNTDWMIQYNLGLACTLIYLLMFINVEKRSAIANYLLLSSFPLFYYLFGGFTLIFLVMYIVYAVNYKKWANSLKLLFVALISFFLFKEFVFLQPNKVLLFNGLPLKSFFGHPLNFYLAILIVVFYPFPVYFFYSVKSYGDRKKPQSMIAVSLYFVVLIFVLFKFYYNEQAANLLKLEKYLFARDWDNLIKNQEKKPSTNLISQYYYNIALSEKGLLCEKLFHGPQDYGPGTIVIPWDSQAGVRNIFRGVYFFYSIGLINEAHRWAFESMVSQGYHPENIKMLIKTNLINGYYLIAEKYIDVLKKTFHYRKLAKKYERMLFNPVQVKADPELAEKIQLQPKQDFSIQIKNPQANVLLMLQANPENKKAFEYKMAWYLLEKNIGSVVKEISIFKSTGYTKLPKHIEEAVLIFNLVSRQGLTDHEDFEVSRETKNRFSHYESSVSLYKGNLKAGKDQISKAFNKTLWFYLDFK